MECIDSIFSVILYILSSILLIVLIVLAFKVMKTLKKVDNVVDDIQTKSTKLDGVFDIVDHTADALSSVSDKLVSVAVGMVAGLFKRKNKKEDNTNE